MNLRRRLARLSAGAGKSAGHRVGVKEGQPEPARAPSGTDDPLQRLRQHLSESLGDAPESTRAAVRLDQLGLDQRQTPEGRFFARRREQGDDRLVGRAQPGAALEASSEVIALLALDAALAELPLRGALYLDTETTGLGGGAGTYAFLVGMAYFEGDSLCVEQFLLAGPEQERAMLQSLAEHLKRAELLVTFNGKSYDVPLLSGRFTLNRMKPPPPRPHLDLLHVARRIHRGRLKSCSLKAVEEQVLGFTRTDDLDGEQVASTYGHYLRSGDATEMGRVLRHNDWDLVSMVALVGLYGSAEPDLDARDLVGFARTLKRAKAHEFGQSVATRAFELGAGADALRVRAEINKALGERLLCLRDLERAEALNSSPQVRLELAKLYEHFSKQPLRARQMVEGGTSEDAFATRRRLLRLEAKLARGDQRRSRT